MKSEKRKYQKVTWGYWKDYQEKLTKDRKDHKENKDELGTGVQGGQGQPGNLLGGCSEEIGGLCCVAFKPVKKDGAVILDTTYQQDVKKCGSLKIQWNSNPSNCPIRNQVRG